MVSINAKTYQTSTIHKICDYIPIVSLGSAIYHLYLYLFNSSIQNQKTINQEQTSLKSYEIQPISKEWGHEKRALFASIFIIGNIILFVHDKNELQKKNKVSAINECDSDSESFSSVESDETTKEVTQKVENDQKKRIATELLLDVDELQKDLEDLQERKNEYGNLISRLQKEWHEELSFQQRLKVDNATEDLIIPVDTINLSDLLTKHTELKKQVEDFSKEQSEEPFKVTFEKITKEITALTEQIDEAILLLDSLKEEISLFEGKVMEKHDENEKKLKNLSK